MASLLNTRRVTLSTSSWTEVPFLQSVCGRKPVLRTLDGSTFFVSGDGVDANAYPVDGELECDRSRDCRATDRICYAKATTGGNGLILCICEDQ